MELTWCLTPVGEETNQPAWWRWHVCTENGVKDSGEADAQGLLELLPAEQAVTLMVPPQALSWHWLPWRPVRKSQEQAYAKGVLADHLLQSPAEVHIALGPLNANKTGRWAAVADLKTLHAQQAWLQQHKHRVVRVLPWWPAPSPDDMGPSWAADAWQDQVLLHAWGQHTAVALQLNADSLGTACQLLNTWRNQQTTTGWCGPAVTQALQSAFEGLEGQHAMRVRNESETIMTALQSPWNLAQGELAPPPTQWAQRWQRGVLDWLRSPASTRATAYALGVLLVNALGLQWVHYKTQEQQAFWKAQHIQVAQEALPANTVVLDPARQLQRALAQTSDPGAPSKARDPWLQVLEKVAQSQSGPRTPLLAMQYQAGQQWQVEWQMPQAQSLGVAKGLFANTPWQLDGNETTWTATAKR